VTSGLEESWMYVKPPERSSWGGAALARTLLAIADQAGHRDKVTHPVREELHGEL
jgi:hypothetical protein